MLCVLRFAVRAEAPASASGRPQVLSGRAAQQDASMRTLEQDLGFVKDELAKLQRATKEAARIAGLQVRLCVLLPVRAVRTQHVVAAHSARWRGGARAERALLLHTRRVVSALSCALSRTVRRPPPT